MIIVHANVVVSKYHLQLAWGVTIHKCQGVTVGIGQQFGYVVFDQGQGDYFSVLNRDVKVLCLWHFQGQRAQ
eukprot:Pgem_evm1s10304